MGDSYRPPGYDHNRRGSSPGRQRNWEGFHTGRPPPPSRSFSNMDARRPNPNTNPGMPEQRKRIASQSPDGAQARKLQRQDTQQNGVTPSNLNGARRSSTTNGIPSAWPTQSGAQSPGSQRPPVPTATIRNDAAIGSSPRSPRESLTSGRSTPQQRPSTLSKETTAQLSNGVSTPITGSTVEPQSESLMDLLNKFSSEIATRAALEHAKNQAEARLFSAQYEYNEMEKHFKVYPAIKERKNTDKNIAREAFLEKERQLNQHTTSQTSTVGSLASLLGQLAGLGADVVSRAEYDSLQKDFLELKQEMTQVKQLRTTLESINSAATEAISRTDKISKLQQKVDLVHRENVASTAWKETVNTKLRDVDKLDQRVKANEKRFATQKDLDDFKQKEASKFATKQQINDLELKVEPFPQKIEALQKAQAKATQDSLNSKPLKEEIVDLQTLGADLTTKTEETATTQEAMTHIIDQLKVDLADCKEKLNVVSDNIEEEGKEPIVKRVKRLDVLVNNLSSKIGNDSDASIRQRLSQLERDSKAIQEDIRSMKSNRQSQPTVYKSTDGTAVDLNPLEARLSNVEKDLDALDNNQDERDTELVKHVENVELSLKAQFSKEITDQLSAARGARDAVEKDISDAIVKMTNGYKEVQKSVDSLEEAIRSKADSATVASLKSDMSSMAEEVKQWQANHQWARSASQTQALAMHVPQTNGQYQAAPQPQQLPNGVVGSPRVNGVRQPQSPYAMQHNHGHGNAQHASNSPQTQKPDDLQLQINGLVAVTQQLKMRCDNLQTDEVVRSMLEQFHAIYPDAKNINSAVQSLRGTLSSVQQQLASLMQQRAPASEQFADDVKKATAKAEGASNTAHTVFQDLQKVWSEIYTIRNAVTILENEVAKRPKSTQEAASSDSSIRDEVTAMREDLDKTTLVANAADRLSRGHATRLSKVVPETLQTRIAAVEMRIGDLDTKVGTHEQKLSKGESTLEKLQSATASARKEIDKIGRNYGQLKYKVERLEEEADD